MKHDLYMEYLKIEKKEKNYKKLFEQLEPFTFLLWNSICLNQIVQL